jgi:hypothetical protein
MKRQQCWAGVIPAVLLLGTCRAAPVAGMIVDVAPARQSLARSDPDRAIDNADSHEYFGENDPYRDVGPGR